MLSHLRWACRLSRNRGPGTLTSVSSRRLKSRALPKYNIPKVVLSPGQNLGVLAVLLATTMCGAVGRYSIAQSTAAPRTTITANPQLEYGTAEDFKLAIQELKDTLDHDGGVSTDQADLIAHGQSLYHHHEGIQLYPLHWTIFAKMGA